jgi:hypothetical protein
VAPTCDDPSAVFIVVEGTAALVMVVERTDRTDYTPLGVGIVVGCMAALVIVVAPTCDAPLGVGIFVVGGTATLGMVVALTARTGDTLSGVGFAPSTVRTGDAPSGVGIVVGGASALGMVVAPACDAGL